MLDPEIYHCCGIIMSPCPTSLFIFLLMLIFLFLWCFPRDFSRWILLTLTVNSFLRISSDIICLFHSSSSSCIWLDVCRAWLYLKVKKPKLKDSSFSQLLYKDFPKRFSECTMFIRDRRNTNLTKNIVMAAPVSMNSTLDNARILDPLLRFVFKNWEVTQFTILLITSNYYLFR